MNYYSGPGKVYINSVALQAQGENGQIVATIDEPTTPVANAMFGRVGETLDDQTGKITVTPFDSWSLLATLYPTFLGISNQATSLSVATNPGALVIGTRPHGATNLPTVIYTPDGRLYQFLRTAITKHPDLKLGTGEALFGACEITALGLTTLNAGASGFLVTANAITESGGSDPGGAFATSDFVRGPWTGVWGTLSGFGGGSGDSPMQAEDFWTISVNAKYSPLKVQKLTRHMKLDSVEIMAKARLVGPSHSQLVGELGTHTLGQLFGSNTNAATLTLSGPNSKTIWLGQAEVKGAGFEFGGTKLGTGEVGFVSKMNFTSGSPQPLLAFSA